MDDPQMNNAMLSGTKTQEQIDEENLGLLSLFHYILGAVTVLGSSFFIIHIVMGLTLAHNPHAFGMSPPASARIGMPSASGRPPDPGFPPEMGYMFAAMGTGVVLGGWTLGGLTIYAGRCLKRRVNSVFIQVIEGLNCVFVMPLGTILGVFTFVVLARPSVKALFTR